MDRLGLDLAVGSTVPIFEPPRFLCVGTYQVQGVPGEDMQHSTAGTPDYSRCRGHHTSFVAQCFPGHGGPLGICLDVQRGHIEMY